MPLELRLSVKFALHAPSSECFLSLGS